MSYITCPKCGEENPGNSRSCFKCGASLRGGTSSGTTRPRPTSTHTRSSYAPSTYSASSYAALRGIASLCTGLGWVIVVLAGLSTVVGVLRLFSRNGFLLGLAIVVLSVVIGGFSFIILQVIAESISVMLDIESNTRRTTSILEQRLK